MSFAQILEHPALRAAEFSAASLRVGDYAPDVDIQIGARPGRLYRWTDDAWTVLFRLPDGDALDNAAELRRLARFLPDFRGRFIKLLGIASADASGDEPLPFAVTQDSDGDVARRYGLAGAAARDVVVIDPEHRLRLLLAYPRGRERDFGDVLRLITALQQADARERASHTDWRALHSATFGAW